MNTRSIKVGQIHLNHLHRDIARFIYIKMINIPTNIEIIGNSLAIKWGDGEDIFLEANHLRKHSPSAENKGESDILAI